MELIEAIFTRHSVDKLLPDAVPQEVIEQLLAAAVQAPNHYRVRPWRFVVLRGEALGRLGDVMAQVLKKRIPEAPDAALVKEREKALRAPLMIVVGVEKPADERVIEAENHSAAAAAAQNLILAAHALGLGAKWRTGQTAYDEDIKQFLGFEPDQQIVAMLYIGYPEKETPVPPREDFADRTLWME